MVSRRLMVRINVDLPPPLGPAMTTTPPVGTSSDTSFSTWSWPYHLWTLLRVITPDSCARGSLPHRSRANKRLTGKIRPCFRPPLARGGGHFCGGVPLIKRVEINYRGIFQKSLAKRIGGDLVIIASRMGKVGFSNGRYSDSPERNGIPCKYFTFVSPDLPEEELEAECGAKLDIDEANISVVLDDTMVKGVEPWGWHGIRPINEKVVDGGALLVVSRKEPPDLLKFIGQKPYNYRIATLEGDACLAGLWVFKDDLTHERVLGAIAAVDPEIISIDAVEDFIKWKYKEDRRAEAARVAYDATLHRVSRVTP